MTALYGHDRHWDRFHSALASGRLHHGWILAGPRGVGKATFARQAAAVLVDPSGAARNLIERGSHPDIITIGRLAKDGAKDDAKEDGGEGEAGLKRNITIDQVRALQASLTTRPGLSDKRVIIIDAADDLERSGANALLKSLEEPPVGTYFFLVSHASDRLLPTIRSRCQMLRFERLSVREMELALRDTATEANDGEIAALLALGNGAPGQALDFIGLELDKLDSAMTSIARDGDPLHTVRIALAEQLSSKSAQPRYEAFLRRVPAYIADVARQRPTGEAQVATEAWSAASSLANRAIPLSLDKQAVVLQMANLLASLQPNKAAR
jgi:DNA polymerase III subunit delta'